MRTLKRGCVGDDVKWLQFRLNEELHYTHPNAYDLIKVDGSFGGITEAMVKSYQRLVGLDDDGSCGPLTQRSLELSDFMVWILDPKKDKIWVAGTPYTGKVYPLKTLKQWANEEGSELTWNLAFFNMTGTGDDKYGPIKGRTLTYCRGKGYDIGYGGTQEKVYIDADNKFAGYKVAIIDGLRAGGSMVGLRARNANGRLADGRIFVVQTLSKKTEYAVVSHMLKNYDVELMLIQDSGGSTGAYFTKDNALIACEKEGKDGRPVATVLCARINGR